MQYLKYSFVKKTKTVLSLIERCESTGWENPTTFKGKRERKVLADMFGYGLVVFLGDEKFLLTEMGVRSAKDVNNKKGK